MLHEGRAYCDCLRRVQQIDMLCERVSSIFWYNYSVGDIGHSFLIAEASGQI